MTYRVVTGGTLRHVGTSYDKARLEYGRQCRGQPTKEVLLMNDNHVARRRTPVGVKPTTPPTFAEPQSPWAILEHYQKGTCT